MNLLVNACQAIEGKGRITIKTYHENGTILLQFRDTGKGIPKDCLEKIFDPGFTTKGVGVGTGLGLSISYKIVEEHKGKIDVDSQVGTGTTVTLRLPVNKDA
jgi:signal transduction histidine kinase